MGGVVCEPPPSPGLGRAASEGSLYTAQLSRRARAAHGRMRRSPSLAFERLPRAIVAHTSAQFTNPTDAAGADGGLREDIGFGY